MISHEAEIGHFFELCNDFCQKILRLFAIGLEVSIYIFTPWTQERHQCFDARADDDQLDDETGGEDWFSTRHDARKGPTGTVLRYLYVSERRTSIFQGWRSMFYRRGTRSGMSRLMIHSTLPSLPPYNTTLDPTFEPAPTVITVASRSCFKGRTNRAWRFSRPQRRGTPCPFILQVPKTTRLHRSSSISVICYRTGPMGCSNRPSIGSWRRLLLLARPCRRRLQPRTQSGRRAPIGSASSSSATRSTRLLWYLSPADEWPVRVFGRLASPAPIDPVQMVRS